MEGGNKFSLNLEAGLDIHTSDMLVPFNSQTFQHNWQKYQGKYLSNSLRYEKNGWAAGWSVYNFDYSTYREKQNGKYVGAGFFNKYVKTLNVYESEEAYSPLYKAYVVPESFVTVGDVAVDGNVITGEVNKKQFKLTWDPVNKTLKANDSSKFGLEYKVNKDYSVTFDVSDLDSYFSYDFDLLTSSDLTGSSVTGVNYTGFDGANHTWGAYEYNINTKKLLTPEGVTLSPSVNNNSLSFSYDHTVNSEYEELSFTFTSFYTKFDVNPTKAIEDQANSEGMYIGASQNPSTSLPFNKYSASVEGSSLVAGDKEGLVINYKLPLWAVISAGFTANGRKAKECDNVLNGEVVVLYGDEPTDTQLIRGKAESVFGETYDFYTKANSKKNESVPIEGLKRRFCKFNVSNTLVKSEDWDFRKVLLTDEMWFGNIKQYSRINSHYGREDIKLMLGDVYTYRDKFYINPNDYLDYNDCYDFEDYNNYVFKTVDLSGIATIKNKNHMTPGDYLLKDYSCKDDEEFAKYILEGLFFQNDLVIYDASNMVCYFTAGGKPWTPYSSSDEAKTYDQLYSDYQYDWGDARPPFTTELDKIYSGGSYKLITTSDDFPYSHIPMFNFKDKNGVVHKGCYWTDGTEYIDDLAKFKKKVMGERDTSIDAKNKATKPNDKYSRDRVVNIYDVAFDFNYIDKANYEDNQEYLNAKNAFDAAWNRWYPDVPNPHDKFEAHGSSSDRTYLNFKNITKKYDKLPFISSLASPGVYLFDDKYALPFTNPQGIVLYEDSSDNNVSVKVWHHSVDVTDTYRIDTPLYKKGKIKYNGKEVSLPNYFGSDKKVKLVYTSEPVTFSGNMADFAEYQIKLIEQQKNSEATLESSEISFGINYSLSGSTFTKVNAKDSNWIKNLLAILSGGKLEIKEAALNGLIQVSEQQFTSDTLQGIKIGWPIWGNSATRLTYTKICDTESLNGNIDTKNYTIQYDEDGSVLPSVVKNDPIIFETVPSSEIEDKGELYFDREDSSMPKSLKLFKVSESSRSLDNGVDKNGNSTGSFSIELSPANSNDEKCVLYFAKKQTEVNDDNKIVEVKSKYYIPGIAYGDPNSDKGNMEVVSRYSVLNVNLFPEKYKFPVNASASFSNINGSSIEHVFFKSEYKLLNDLACEFSDINFTKFTRDIVVKFPGKDLKLTYSSDSTGEIGDFTCTTNQLVLSRDYEKVTVTSCDFGWSVDANNNNNVIILKNKIFLGLKIDLSYKNNEAKFLQVSGASLKSSDGDLCVLSNSSKNSVTYSVQSQNTVSVQSQDVVESNEGVKTDVVSSLGKQSVKIERVKSIKCNAFLKSVFNGSIDGSKASFTYDGNSYTWDMSKKLDTGVYVTSTDIKTNKTKRIGKIEHESEYQLLKQQWNSTVEVENFWWLDSKHVLELNNSKFIVKRNTGELHDWDGERFSKVCEAERDKILPTKVLRHFVTNVYDSNNSAVLVTAQENLGYIKLTFYSPLEAFKELGSVQIQVKLIDIGQTLNKDSNIDGSTAIFNTYNPLDAMQLLSKAEWSNAMVGDYIVIGVHLSNNFDQWAIVLKANGLKLSSVIQGYGFVGLHGDLTGGQIPDMYFNATKGFNSKVEPLSVLVGKTGVQYANNIDAAYEVEKIDSVNNITDRVVGTGKQQWYISKKIYGIVSHLEFSSTSGTYTKKVLPITNNYVSKYASPSWASSVLGDTCVSAKDLADLFDFDGIAKGIWQTLMTALTRPHLVTLVPRLAYIAYLQQTFGQYAYVHYNSSNNMPEPEIKDGETDSGLSEKTNKQQDPVLSSDFTFDKQKFTQKASTSSNAKDNKMAMLMGLITAFSSSLQVIDKKQSVNEELNLSTIADSGRRFVDNAIANTSDLLASAIVTQSRNDTGLTSIVTGLKSLDMFYSTSDQQHVYAGPGFVEHQFVADCIAQSVTDTQVEGRVQQMFFCFRSLTTLQIRLAIRIEEAIADGMDKAAEATAAQMVCANSLGLVGVAIHAAATAIRAVVQVQKNGLIEIEKFLDAIANRPSVSQDGAVSRHALSIEGKHKYGEKNEAFMWPCWGISSGSVKYTDEYVECDIKNTPWKLTLNSVKVSNKASDNKYNKILSWEKPNYSSNAMNDNSSVVEKNCGIGGSWDKDKAEDANSGEPGDTYRAYYMYGNVPFYQIALYGKSEDKTLPDDMACIEGVNRFLPNEPFKNENISVSEPVFAPSLHQDYIIDKNWELSMYCTYGLVQWVSVKDTKVIDCPPSNIVVSSTFCGIACPYTAVEVKRGIEKAYMRPYAITPNAVALNCTGYNALLDNKLYHAFDGLSYRLVSLVGSPGMNKNRQSFWYSFQVNDRFKRSNKLPANELQGNFQSEPVQAIESIDKLWTSMTVASKEKGLIAGTIGEDKDLIRWSVPVFTEHVSTLPAVVKTLTAVPLGVVEGITSLCVGLVNNQTAYKAPLSIDFNINKNIYRATEEFICSVKTDNGVDVVTDIVPISGLKFIGSTPTEAYFYSSSTGAYYTFTGSSLTKMDTMERFRDIQKGYWDFVNQEVIMPCLMTFKRLNAEVEDKDTETDNIVVPVLSRNQVSGELPPPITTIFNDRSWFNVVSLPSGLAYQGPNRVIINRNIFVEYMLDTIKGNLGKWSKMNREKYVTHREYREKYSDIMSAVSGVDGWTYNPFVLVTSALGDSEGTDCMFEWVITFCWPVEMDLIYGVDNYACVNVVAETMTPGGKMVTRPTHIFLHKELFTRNGNYGYYSFRFQSKNGMGNRERLHIWSDQYIAISSIVCEYKVMTSRRTEQLTQQVDVSKLKEL